MIEINAAVLFFLLVAAFLLGSFWQIRAYNKFHQIDQVKKQLRDYIALQERRRQ